MLGDFGLWDPQEMLVRGNEGGNWCFIEVLGMRLGEWRLCSKFQGQKKESKKEERTEKRERGRN